MTERKLASVQIIQEIKPIEGADRICAYRINGWWVVDQKGKYIIGDFVVYCEVDSWVPHLLAPFLSKGKEPRVYDGISGERLRTVKLKGQVSQGLLLDCSKVLGVYHPVYFNESGRHAINVFTENTEGVTESNFIYEGDDLSEKLGIVKYEIPVPAQLAGFDRGNFPSDIPKTDQQRIQNIRNFDDYLYDTYERTEKLHGSSCTFYLDTEEVFHVCSRNIDLKFDENNSFWEIAIQKDVEARMRAIRLFGVAIQGELIGEGINGNQYKVELDFRVFDIYNAINQQYCKSEGRLAICDMLGLHHVPVVEIVTLRDNCTVQSLLEAADGISLLNNSQREGDVYKSITDPSKSFKVVSVNWLLHNE